MTLRRGPLSIVMGRPFGPVPLVLALVFVPAGLVDPMWFYVAGFCLVLVALPLGFPLRISDGALTVPSLLLVASRQPLDELTALDLGTYRFGAGFGYSGTALVLHTADSARIVSHSFYCGGRRLQRWIETIDAADGFTGEIRRSEAVQGRNGMSYFP